MAVPKSKESRLFYRSAIERSTDADILRREGRSTGAVYLAGYGVECMLKALILAQLPAGLRAGMIGSFKGSRGHDFEWLRGQYYNVGGPRFPDDIIESFEIVDSWSTGLRYNPARMKPGDAITFLHAADRIFSWADGRL